MFTESSNYEGAVKDLASGRSLGKRMFSLNSRYKSHISEGLPSPEQRDITQIQHAIENKKEQRQSRRSLRASGDFLGVQGANPRTGR